MATAPPPAEPVAAPAVVRPALVFEELAASDRHPVLPLAGIRWPGWLLAGLAGTIGLAALIGPAAAARARRTARPEHPPQGTVH